MIPQVNREKILRTKEGPPLLVSVLGLLFCVDPEKHYKNFPSLWLNKLKFGM